MKNIKNILVVIAAITLVIPTFNSCRKGPEDPFLSMRSRDKRIEGTWTLKTVDYTFTEKKVTATKNTVNTATTDETENTTYTVSGDGAAMTTTKKYTDNTVDKYKTPMGTWTTDQTDTDTEDKSETWTKAYTITVSIYKDNTYKYTVTEKASNYVYHRVKTFNGTTTSTVDTTYAGSGTFSTDEVTTTLYGTWTWDDELAKSAKDKIIINAGPLSGYLARLSNKELTLDYTYQSLFGSPNYFVDDVTYQNKSATDDNTIQATTNSYSDFTYSGFTTKTGTKTITTTTTTNVVSGKSTWEKTDKKRKREAEEKK